MSTPLPKKKLKRTRQKWYDQCRHSSKFTASVNSWRSLLRFVQLFPFSNSGVIFLVVMYYRASGLITFNQAINK
jgi:hypothetical protein